MPLDALLRGLWAMRLVLVAAALALLLAGSSLILAWPRAYLAQAVVAPAETTGLAAGTLIAPSPLGQPGALLDTRPTGNFAVYLAALRSPEAAALLARETELPRLLREAGNGGALASLRRVAGLALPEPGPDAAAEWLSRNLAVTQGLGSVTWTLSLPAPEREMAVALLARLHAFAEAKVRADIADLAARRVAALEARIAGERDMFLRQPMFDLLAQHQRALVIMASDEAVAARLVSAPGAPFEPSLPNRGLLLMLLAIAAPLATLLGAACLVLARGETRVTEAQGRWAAGAAGDLAAAARAEARPPREPRL
jgi:hypothetical protein